MGGQPFALEKVRDGIVTDPIEVFCQVCTGEVGGRANQKFNVLKFGRHDRILPRGSLKRKSCLIKAYSGPLNQRRQHARLHQRIPILGQVYRLAGKRPLTDVFGCVRRRTTALVVASLFSNVPPPDQHSKTPAPSHEPLYRCAVLCAVMTRIWIKST